MFASLAFIKPFDPKAPLTSINVTGWNTVQVQYQTIDGNLGGVLRQVTNNIWEDQMIGRNKLIIYNEYRRDYDDIILQHEAGVQLILNLKLRTIHYSDKTINHRCIARIVQSYKTEENIPTQAQNGYTNTAFLDTQPYNHRLM